MIHRLYIKAANVPSPRVVRKTPFHHAPSWPFSLNCLSRPSWKRHLRISVNTTFLKLTITYFVHKKETASNAWILLQSLFRGLERKKFLAIVMSPREVNDPQILNKIRHSLFLVVSNILYLATFHPHAIYVMAEFILLISLCAMLASDYSCQSS